MREETKAAFQAALEQHAVQKAAIERKKAQELAQLEERAIGARRLRDDVILPALKEIADDLLLPNGWHSIVRSGPSGISATIEIYKGEMMAVNGKRPMFAFSLDSAGQKMTLSEATLLQDIIGEPQKLSVITEDFVQDRALKFFQKLSREAIG